MKTGHGLATVGCILCAIASVAPGALPVADSSLPCQPEQLSVLIITGSNNHEWQSTTKVLRQACEQSGRFVVDVTLTPETLTVDSISKYDVLVSNWNAFGKGNLRWGETAEKAVEDFVRKGKGLAAFHAGSASLHDWAAFQEILGGTWAKGTSHGARSSFTVTFPTEHPVTAGIKDFETNDELWYNLANLHPSDSRKVLATAYCEITKKQEPVALCTEYGKGRGFMLVLGHDAKALQNEGTSELLLNGIEWAASGAVCVNNDNIKSGEKRQ